MLTGHFLNDNLCILGVAPDGRSRMLTTHGLLSSCFSRKDITATGVQRSQSDMYTHARAVPLERLSGPNWTQIIAARGPLEADSTL